MSQPIKGRGHIVLPISPKNTNLVEGVKILLPGKLKFCQIPFSSFRGYFSLQSSEILIRNLVYELALA